jgi:threonine/homoserine/homoserine lactone efflux protein
MEISLTFTNITALFLAMVILGLLPSISVLAVSTRSVGYGFIHGVFTTMGIVLGDIIFILLAIYGLSIITQTMGNLFVFIRCIGGVYLIWLGIELWRKKPKEINFQKNIKSSFLASFLTGFFITLADIKAIFFYLSFLPAFVDLANLSLIDTGIIIFIATIAVGGAKLTYAFLGHKASHLFQKPHQIKKINIVMGSVMITIGLFLLIKYN